MSFWSPKSVKEYESLFSFLIREDCFGKKYYALRKNLSYNLQFVEFIINTLRNDEYHSVVGKQLRKTLILTCSSIIETILYCILKKERLNRKKEWDKKEPFKSNSRKIENDFFKSETIIYKKITPVEDHMTFDWMIKKCQAKRLLGNNQTVYDNLKKIKKT